MRTRRLGQFSVSESGFGIMSFASAYGVVPDGAESIRVIRGAHGPGLTLFDAAEHYGPWTNEGLVGEALSLARDRVAVATKLGWNIDPEPGELWPGLDSRLDHVSALPMRC